MTYKTMTITDAIKHIDQAKLYLPALQRKFIWRKHQIELLFDSIMRDYPIGTFLFWRLNSKRAQEYVFYEFLKEYDQREPYNRRKTGPFTHEEILGVLDGQQRLSSLYLGLMGTHTEKAPYKRHTNSDAYEKMCLYLNLFTLPYSTNGQGSIEINEERNFEFRFLIPAEAKGNLDRRVRSEDNDLHASERTEPVFWLKVSDVLSWDRDPELDHMFEEFDHRCTSESQKQSLRQNKRRIMKGLGILHNRICRDEVLNYFEIPKDDLEDILKIFVRVNSGGTVLEKADLLFSTIVATWDDGREEIEKLLKDINSKGETFRFTNEYLMRCCLVLTDAPVVYKVNSFKSENVEKIRIAWPNIRTAVSKTVELLADLGFNGTALTSLNATIIIAYHIYCGGDLDDSSKSEIRKYLVHALLTRIFGSSQDQLLVALRNALREEHVADSGEKAYRLRSQAFTFAQILTAGLPNRKTLTVSEREIDLFLARKKGADAFAVLALLYPHLRFHDQVFHQDHIHPSSHFTPERFAQMGLTAKEQEYWLECRDSVANLQLMKGKENVEKNATALVDWMAGMPEHERLVFRKDNYFPENVGLEFSNFAEFHFQRKKILIEKLRSKLALASGNDFAQSANDGEAEYMVESDADESEESRE